MTESGTIALMTPEDALLRVIHCLDRSQASGFKTKAFVRALDVVRSTDPTELERRAAAEQAVARGAEALPHRLFVAARDRANRLPLALHPATWTTALGAG